MVNYEIIETIKTEIKRENKEMSGNYQKSGKQKSTRIELEAISKLIAKQFKWEFSSSILNGLLRVCVCASERERESFIPFYFQ